MQNIAHKQSRLCWIQDLKIMRQNMYFNNNMMFQCPRLAPQRGGGDSCLNQRSE